MPGQAKGRDAEVSASICKQPETAARRYGLPRLGLRLINHRSLQTCKQRLWHHYCRLDYTRRSTSSGLGLAQYIVTGRQNSGTPHRIFNLVFRQQAKTGTDGL